MEEAEAAIAAHEPDVVLLDVHMPDGGGVEVIRRAAAAGTAAARFLALSVSDAAEDVIAVIRAGARGYVTKNISAGRAGRRRAARATTATPCSRRGWPASCSTPSPARRRQPETELDLLTPREREVLQHIARGYMYKEIALRPGDLAEDRGGARVVGAAQAPALEPPRAQRAGPPSAASTSSAPTGRGRSRASASRSLIAAALVVHLLALRHAPARPWRAGP